MTRLFPPDPPQKTGRGGGKGECDYCQEVKPVMHIRVPIKGTIRTEFKMCCEDCLPSVPEWQYDDEWMKKFFAENQPQTLEDLVKNLTSKVMEYIGPKAEPDEIIITFDENEGRIIKEWIIPVTDPDSIIKAHHIEIDDDEMPHTVLAHELDPEADWQLEDEEE